MKFTNYKLVIALFVILILLLALSVYIKPLLEGFGTFSVDISGVTHSGSLTQSTEYEIDISGVTYTGTVDLSNNKPGIVNENNIFVGSGGNPLNDIYLPGGTAGSGGHYTSPLDFMHNFQPSTGMYTDTSDTSAPDTSAPFAADQTTHGLPEGDDSQLGTLGVDYYKCMEGDYTPPTDDSAEPIGTYYYFRNYNDPNTPFTPCNQQVAPCAQFNDPSTGEGSETRCTGFTSRQGRQLCDYTPATYKNVTDSLTGNTTTVVDISSSCVAKTSLNPPFLVDAPAPAPDAAVQ